jgi:hypothetical protein
VSFEGVLSPHEQETKIIWPNSRGTFEADRAANVRGGPEAEESGHDGAVVRAAEIAAQELI